MDQNTAQDDLAIEVNQLAQKIESVQLPEGLKAKLNSMFTRLKRMVKYGGYNEEYEKISHYINWIISLPWDYQTEDNMDLNLAQQVMNKHHYGMQSVKDKILEYMAVLKLNRDKAQLARAPIILLLGLVGTGKTTFAKSLSESMGRSYARIPFGGMGSARDLRGQSRLHLDAEPGKIIKALVAAKSRNPVILLDEIDRVSDEARADIMGVLVELLDPEQNSHFIDHYIDYPFNLSDVLFIATANNTKNISTAVMDRIEVIEMPSYSDEEKIAIGRDYILPRVIKEAGLKPEQIKIPEEIWPKIVRPLGYDSGIRSLERTIKGVVHKTARMVVEGKGYNFAFTEENIKQFLPSY